MDGTTFPLSMPVDLAFAIHFVILCGIRLWTGRKEKADADDYFLAGRTLPWYGVGSSFIASNISSEHFIGMIEADHRSTDIQLEDAKYH
ncbi:MAG: hypothetical protein ABGX16_17290 [Pirellulales bacterium]